MADDLIGHEAKNAYRSQTRIQETTAEQTNRARLPAGVVIESSAHVLRQIDNTRQQQSGREAPKRAEKPESIQQMASIVRVENQINIGPL